MVGLNHEIRFKVSKEEREYFDRLYSEIGADFFKAKFFKQLFLLGYQKALQFISEKNPEQLKTLLMNQKIGVHRKGT